MCCGSPVVTSGQYVINLDDLKKVGRNFIVFSSPSLAIGLAAWQGTLDPKIAMGAFCVNIVNTMIDLGKKFADTPK